MRIGQFALLISLAASAAAAQQPADDAPEEPREKCFGVALAGQNEGIGTGDDTSRASVDYQGDAWVSVPRGTCQTMTLPAQADGTPRRGAIRPLDRDQG